MCSAFREMAMLRVVFGFPQLTAGWSAAPIDDAQRLKKLGSSVPDFYRTGLASPL